MSILPGLAMARMGYYGPPLTLVLPAEDGSHYAEECHRSARRRDRPVHVLCREHGLQRHAEHMDVHDAPPLASREDVRRLASLIRTQIGWFEQPLYCESWLWRADEEALALSRRVLVLRAPMADMHVLERLGWLAADEED